MEQINNIEASAEQPVNPGLKAKLKFIIPSLLGALLFMLPLQVDGEVTIPAKIVASMIMGLFGENLPLVIVSVITLTTLVSTWTIIAKPSAILNRPLLKQLFFPAPIWYGVRVLGMLFVWMTYFKVGPEFIWSGDTGGLILHDLMPTLFAVFIFAGMVLPLLLNFGLLEFVGTVLTKFMRPVFNLPGRAAIDSMASWLGDGSVGILMTSKQYEAGAYTQREAVVVGTTFSAVSITFTLVIISQVDLAHLFAPFYLTVCLAGIVAALIVPRLPPLSRRKDVYIDGSKKHPDDEVIPAGHSTLSWAWHTAVEQANQPHKGRKVLQEGVQNSVDMVLGVLPVIMGVGTTALVLAEYTPIFDWLGMPFIPLLELFHVPEAVAASKTMVVGFADMFIPALLASSIESEMTRFIVAALSVTQLIYMSEVGALLMGTKIPVKLWELFVIFIVRTLVSLPVIVAMAHLIF